MGSRSAYRNVGLERILENASPCPHYVPDRDILVCSVSVMKFTNGVAENTRSLFSHGFGG